METPGAPIFEARSADKVFPSWGGTVHALHAVSFSLLSGQSLGIVGESGAGKSTILSLLLGLEKPSAGAVFFHGRPVDPADRARMSSLRREVQVVFQDPRTSLDPRMRVGAIIAEPLRAQRIPGDHAAAVRGALESVGLDPSMAGRYPREFSGGQRQRIAIARALAPRPKVLIADEPVSALDVSVRTKILDLIESLKGRLGLTLVLVSHDLAVVGRLCDQILVLKDGRIVESGATRALFSNPRSAYTRRLLDSVPTLAM